jgi:hypothetical protein
MQCFLISKDLKQEGGKIWAPPSLHPFLKKAGMPYDEASEAPTRSRTNQVTVVASDGTKKSVESETHKIE